mmetsp:Transcript_38717/g.84230  ORF Transcript_38717/g.84230 Transcript_38717/m.84230 type:complete len:240 (-) Transcript_38717:1106-1825(-)
MVSAGTSDLMLSSSTWGLGANWKCDSASSRTHSALNSALASACNSVSSSSAWEGPARACKNSSSYSSPRPFLLFWSSSSTSLRLAGASEGVYRTTSSNLCSMIRCMIICSRLLVISSVMTGGGAATCSKSRSTSSALFLGRAVAITSPRMCHSAPARARASSSSMRAFIRCSRFSCVDIAFSSPSSPLVCASSSPSLSSSPSSSSSVPSVSLCSSPSLSASWSSSLPSTSSSLPSTSAA